MIRVTLEGATWQEIEGQAMELVRQLNASPAPPQVTRTYSEDAHLASVPRQQVSPPPQVVPLPLDKPPASGLMPPTEYECAEHHQPLRHKPAGVSRQGNPYAAGWRCPAQGCRTFVPDEGVA